MNTIDHPTTSAVIRKKRKIKIMNSQGHRPKSQFTSYNFLSTPVSNAEAITLNNHHPNKPVFDNADVSTTATNHFKSDTNISLKVKDNIKMISKIKDQNPQIVHTDDSENSSEEKGSSRKDRKPLPLIFNRSHPNYADNSDSSSEASDTKEKESCKCMYLGERETLRSFWDKCLYQCFKSKRCVAGEKPKRKYRKKLKTPKPPSKKRKHPNPPMSCIDIRGTATTHNDYLSRYEMLLFMDPLAESMTPWQKKDFEMAFRMVKPTDIFTKSDDNSDEFTDYTNSDTDQECL